MADYAHEQTDKIIEKMEKQVAKEYKQAEKELTKKIKDYLKKFEEKDKAKQKQLADGQITQEEYNNWKIGQIATGDRWKAMRDTLAEEITKANDIAKSTINGHMEDVYSLNHNYATYQVEKDAMIDTSYTLYNRRSTEELFKNKKSLLPAPKEGTQAWYAAHNKDLRWNQQKINSSMIQGILQGDSIPQIAKRLREVVGMNSRSAMRNARTMTTSIENKGRDDAYSELREKGIELETVWIATLDDRTRHSHRLLHGEIRDEKTGKYSNGLRYPADPMGEPEEVYNCRCAETSYVKGFPVDIPKWSPKMGDMTYEEWLGEHEEKEAVSIEEAKITSVSEAKEYLSTMFHVENNISKIDDDLLVANTNRLKDLNDRFGAIAEDNTGYISSSNQYYKGQTAYATCQSTFRTGNRVSFNLCEKYYSDGDYLVESELKSRDKGWSMPFSDEFAKVVTVTHEYGHALQSVLMRDYIDLNDFEAKFKEKLRGDTRGTKAVKFRNDTEKKAAKTIWKEIVDIAVEKNANFSVSQNLSDYGKSNFFEAFAETFANALCGNPNELGDAMNIWLERKGF